MEVCSGVTSLRQVVKIQSIVLYVLSIYLFSLSEELANMETTALTQFFSGHLQFAYLVVIAVVMMIDSVGTITFRWKEYGEITHQQADATR